MKKVSKTLAIVLCLALILSLSALANWTTFAGNNDHNAVVSSSPTSSSPDITEIALMGSGGGWDGVDTSPLMRTVGTGDDAVTYAYVLYDGHSNGGRLAKIDCSADTPHVVWDKLISGNNNFLLSTPLLVPGTTEANDVIYLASAVGDKYALTSYNVTLPVSNVNTQTVSATIPEVKTASNRVAMGIYLGRATTQGAITTTGTAVITVDNTSVTVNVSPNNNGTGVNYKTFEKEVYDTGGNVIAYDYYWYINHNISDNDCVGNSTTVSVAVSLTGGTGTIEYMDVYANRSSIQKVTGLNASTDAGVTNTSIYGVLDGQINTPITTDGTYLYFGTYTGYNTPGTYYQIDINGNEIGAFTTSAYGFYWSGAGFVTQQINGVNYTFAFFGSDNGKLYWRYTGAFSSVGNVLDLSTSGVTPGNIRSTIMTNGSDLYFTSQGGYLWCCTFNASNSTLSVSWKAELKHSANGSRVTSTSTPTKVGNRIYVGAYGGTSKSGVLVVDAASPHAVTSVIQNNSTPVQSTIVVNGTGSGMDYLYYVDNGAAGTGHCITWNGTSHGSVWDCSAYHSTYALGNMAIENGIAVFGNDHNYLYVVRDPAPTT